MTQDVNGIIRSLHTAAVNRCRERLDAAANRARGMIHTGEADGGRVYREPQYGITSVLKKRHGL